MSSVKKKFSIKDYVWASKLEDRVSTQDGQQASTAEIAAPPTAESAAPTTVANAAPTTAENAAPTTSVRHETERERKLRKFPLSHGKFIWPDFTQPTKTEREFLGSLASPSSALTPVASPSSALTPVRDGPHESSADLLQQASRQLHDVQRILETVKAREREGRALRELLRLAEGDDVVPAVQDLVIQVTSQAAQLDLVQRDFEMQCGRVAEMSTAMADLRNMAKELQLSCDAKDASLRDAKIALETERQNLASLLRITAFLN